MGGATTNPRGSNEPHDLAKKRIIYNFFFFTPKIKSEYPNPKFCLNPTKISLNMIILVLLS